MRSRIQRSATLLLAVFTVGALLLPLAHEFTHIRSLEHRHGRAAADFSVSAGHADAADFLVEERTVPHNPNCDLCARLSLDSPPVNDTVVPFWYVDDSPRPKAMAFTERIPISRQIRAPPFVS